MSETGTATNLSEQRYTELFDAVAKLDGGMDFLREHAHRAGRNGQRELKSALDEMRGMFEEQAVLLRQASRADVLRRELQEMAATIEQARREVAALQPKNADNNRLMIATNELDAIVSTTERASFEILQSAERLMELAGKARTAGLAGEIAAEMDAEITTIFTACSFQDLTGQRMSKVVSALRYVEQRVMAMMGLWNGSDGSVAAASEEPTDTRPDAHLLGGPRDDGVSQDDVDALMNGSVAPKPTAKAPGPTPTPLDQSAIDNLFE